MPNRTRKLGLQRDNLEYTIDTPNLEAKAPGSPISSSVMGSSSALFDDVVASMGVCEPHLRFPSTRSVDAAISISF